MIRRSPWPALTDISWLLKSRNRRPSAVWKWTPLAPVTGRGFRPAWADQSYRVWRRQSSVISSADRALTASITTPASYSHRCLTSLPAGVITSASRWVFLGGGAYVSRRIRLSRSHEPGRGALDTCAARRRGQGAGRRSEPHPLAQAALLAARDAGRHRPHRRPGQSRAGRRPRHGRRPGPPRRHRGQQGARRVGAADARGGALDRRPAGAQPRHPRRVDLPRRPGRDWGSVMLAMHADVIARSRSG